MNNKVNEIELLDCTLRDGGYINNWDFGSANIENIIALLSGSGIETVECGFYKIKDNNDLNSTLFSSFPDFERIVPAKRSGNYSLMINFGEIPDDKLINNCSYPVEIRIAFKKHHLNGIKDFAKKLIDRGFFVSLNPMHASLYTKKELDYLIEIANELNPVCLTVVDTMGIMTEEDTSKLFKYIDKNLIGKTAIGFHSHNNLQLSFSNTKKLISLKLNRKIIIDCCILGMGRGAGILPTELIAQYLNTNCGKNYNVEYITQAADRFIRPLEIKYKWGYSYPFYLSARNRCHPNYAKFLIDNYDFSFEEMDKIFHKIPEDEKTNFSKEVVKKIIKPLQ